MDDRRWIYKADAINEEIKELEKFISVAEKVWAGKLIAIETKYIFKTVAFGTYNSVEYKMDTLIKNKMLDILRWRKDQLLIELEEIRRG